MRETTGQKNAGTKEKILHAAIGLFSDGGYNDVSMRDIAKVVGIHVSSLYSHFVSKDEILNEIYDYYSFQLQKAYPDIGELLVLAETEEPKKVLMKLDFRFDPDIQETMDRIIRIICLNLRKSSKSEAFLKKHFYDFPANILAVLLNRMVDLGKIKPLDIKAFVLLIVNYSLGSSILHGTSLAITPEDWRAGLELGFSIIRENRETN